METRLIRALRAFTDYTPTGMVVFNAGTVAELPARMAASRVESGRAEYADADASDAIETAIRDAIADGVIKGVAAAADGTLSPEIKGDGTGEPLPPIDPDALPDGYAMDHKGFGKYEISGPGIEDGTVIKGKADAITAIAIAAAGQADDTDAPAD